jgi:hypothetical protein
MAKKCYILEKKVKKKSFCLGFMNEPEGFDENQMKTL